MQKFTISKIEKGKMNYTEALPWWSQRGAFEKYLGKNKAKLMLQEDTFSLLSYIDQVLQAELELSHKKEWSLTKLQ